MVSVDRWYDLIEAATVASGDPFLGLHFGIRKDAEYRTGAGVMRLLVIARDTLRIALDRLARLRGACPLAVRFAAQRD